MKGQAMKFDLDTAWRDAMGLLKGNLGLLATIAGVFYFLPNAAATSLVPEIAQLSNPAPGMDLDAMIAMIEATVAQNWWLFLSLLILGGIGSLAMLALMRQRAKPTVGQALATGLRSIPSYLGAQLLQGLLIVSAATLLITLPAATGSTALRALGVLAAFVVIPYLLIKLIMIAPAIAIEGELNPVTAIKRSWTLTKGNSWRLFLFFVLLVLAFFVISSVVSMFGTLALAFASAKTAQFGMAVIEAGTSAVGVVIGACILAAIHTQLSRLRGSPEVASEA
ncbi:MAG: glycerophosphoryl diester phosphodiesterase membrane domain-containing protein [Erythrobacter sp.]